MAQLNLASLNGNNGFIVNGINDNDKFGYSINSGDINGDNITDLLVTAPQALNFNGQGYVIFGTQSPFPALFDLGVINLDGNNGFVINGIGGSSISKGDINGDNITDIFIGASVIFGSKSPFPASINLSSLNGAIGFVVNAYDDNSISSGDINGDGIADLLIGTPRASLVDSRQGQGCVVFGSRNSFPAILNLSSLNGTNGFIFNGTNINDNLGRSIASGDVNGDYIDDLLIGAPNGTLVII